MEIKITQAGGVLHTVQGSLELTGVTHGPTNGKPDAQDNSTYIYTLRLGLRWSTQRLTVGVRCVSIHHISDILTAAGDSCLNTIAGWGDSFIRAVLQECGN